MSIKIAKATLGRAFAELRRARDREDERQAGEKGWRAAREAVYAVIAAVDPSISLKGTLGYGAVQKFEVQYFGKMTRNDQRLASGYGQALNYLHGQCFYEDVCEFDMENQLAQVGKLMECAEEYLEYASFAHKAKRKKRGK